MASLLAAVDAQVTRDGVWHAVDTRRKASDAALAAARVRYLEQRCLLDAADDLALEADALLADVGAPPAFTAPSSSGASGGGAGMGGAGTSGVTTSAAVGGSDASIGDAQAAAALKRAGLACGADTYRSLSRHLQAARALQRLELPGAPQSGGVKGAAAAAPAQRDTDADTDVERDGSTRHLLGVTPDAMRSAYCLPRGAAQHAHAAAAKELEGRLVALAGALVATVMGEEAAGDPAAAAQAVEAVRAATALADASEADAERALSEATRLCAGYLGTLNAIHAALLELVEGCVLTQQPRLDEQHAQWLVAHVRTLHSKLRVLQGQLHVATYTSESAPALRRVAAALGEEEAAARAAIEQASAQLLGYQECGPEFADVVAQYSQVKEEMRQVERALHHFSALERELAEDDE